MASDNSRFLRAAALFEQCVELDPAARDRLLRETCAEDDELREEVESLLAHDQVEQPTATSLRSLIDSVLTASFEPEALPKEIAGFRIIREIGRGGMGVVYEAEQSEPRRRVAVKVVPGLSSRELSGRMRQEAQALALIEDAGVARIYETGMATVFGRQTPYIAMELVRGQTIDQFVIDQEAGIARRLRLMARVADAIQAAHTRGVIHRDLKPGNILVIPEPDGPGRPKVVDFGIARLTSTDLTVLATVTHSTGLAGTLRYMSPEQLSGDPALIDARSDVYGLGAVAYTVLAGREPFDTSGMSLTRAISMISESDPARLGTINRVFRGDIELVIAKAMAKEPGRRYPTASEFAADLRRIVNNEPVVARPPSTTYRVRKFVRRNKVLTASTVMVMLLMVSALIVVSQQRQRAMIEADTASQVTDFLEQLILSASPNALGKNVTVREAITIGEAMLDGRFESNPVVEARLRMTLGTTHRALGDLQRSLENYKRAAEIYADIEGPLDRKTLYARGRVGVALRNLGDNARAIIELNEVLMAQERAFGTTDDDTLTTLNSLAIAFSRSGDLRGAQDMLERLLRAYEIRGVTGIPLYSCLHNLATTYRDSGQFQKALPLLLEARRGYEDAGDRIAVLTTDQVLGGLYRDLGRLEDAEHVLRTGLERAEDEFPAGHYLVSYFQARLGFLLIELGEPEEARGLLNAFLTSPTAESDRNMSDRCRAALESLSAPDLPEGG